MSSFEAFETPSPIRFKADPLAALMGGAAYANQTKAPAQIAETLVRAEKTAALAIQLADRAATIVNRLLGSSPEATGQGEKDSPEREAVIVRELNDRLTGTMSALNRIDHQLGRLQGAIG